MRLLDTYSGRFRWVNHPSEVPYAILSHVWDGNNELSFQQLSAIHLSLDNQSEPSTVLDKLPSKIQNFLRYARDQGYAYGWVDTCCIDKGSSAELSEAINSMYVWYQQASVCYAYLADVEDHEYLRHSSPGIKEFSGSRWFTRGWTLQELIAPKTVLFLSKGWRFLGTKSSLTDPIQEITSIDRKVLAHACSVTDISVASRMTWAAPRKTTRVEDQAYSLMGLFGVHMSTIYGEGRHAFVRLQEEIMKQVPDQTIFAWGPRLLPTNPKLPPLRDITSLMPFPEPHHPFSTLSASDGTMSSSRPPTGTGNLLASSPQDFHPLEAQSRKSSTIAYDMLQNRLQRQNLSLPTYTITPYGIRTRMPIFPIRTSSQTYGEQLMLGVLACVDEEDRVLALLLSRPATTIPSGDILSAGALSPTGHSLNPDSATPEPAFIRVVALSDIQLKLLARMTNVKDLCIFHRHPQQYDLDQSYKANLWSSRVYQTARIAPWCFAALQGQGFEPKVVDEDGPSSEVQPLIYLTIRRREALFKIVFGHCLDGSCCPSRPGFIRAVVYYHSDNVSAGSSHQQERARAKSPMSQDRSHPDAPHILHWQCSPAGSSIAFSSQKPREDPWELKLTVRVQANDSMALVLELEMLES